MEYNCYYMKFLINYVNHPWKKVPRIRVCKSMDLSICKRKFNLFKYCVLGLEFYNYHIDLYTLYIMDGVLFK